MNPLYKDTPTKHRVMVHGRPRVVYSRSDREGNFVRFIVEKTRAEIRVELKAYHPAKVGISDWYEVQEYNFA